MRVSRSRGTLLVLGVVGALALGAVKTATETGQRENAPCTSTSARDYVCYREHYLDLVRDSGARAAIGALKAEYIGNPFVRTSCHQLVHDIGRVAAAHYADIPTAFRHGDELCAAGYYHGVMQTVVAKIGADRIRTEINSICAGVSRQQAHPLNRLECVHGLGHGLMVAFSNEVFESLQTCDLLTETVDERQCHNGVFMENAVMGLPSHHEASHPSRYHDPDQPLYPCASVAARYKHPCYLYQTTYALQAVNGDFGRLFELCAGVNDGFRGVCYQGVGREADGKGFARFVLVSAQTRYTSIVCMMGRNHEARSNCIVGAVKSLITENRTDAEAKMLCGFLGADLRGLCFQQAKEYHQRLDGIRTVKNASEGP